MTVKMTAFMNEVPLGGDNGNLGINLRWHGVGDLDLGCLVIMDNDWRWCVQDHSQFHGSLDQPPFIQFVGHDDRTGLSKEGENLLCNLVHSLNWRAILIFVHDFGDGNSGKVADWKALSPVITLTQPYGPIITIPVEDISPGNNACAVAMIEHSPDGHLIVRRLMTSHTDQIGIDRYYNWGLQWTIELKTPET